MVVVGELYYDDDDDGDDGEVDDERSQKQKQQRTQTAKYNEQNSVQLGQKMRESGAKMYGLRLHLFCAYIFDVKAAEWDIFSSV